MVEGIVFVSQLNYVLMLMPPWQHFFPVGRNFHIIYIMTKAQVGSLFVAVELSKTLCTRIQSMQ